jgi:hypothetical protein
MYAFGALTRDAEGQMYRTGGIRHTIKDGIVIENEKLMREVERMVRESKRGTGENVVSEPFATGGR